jgi:hypothetical protein
MARALIRLACFVAMLAALSGCYRWRAHYASQPQPQVVTQTVIVNAGPAGPATIVQPLPPQPSPRDRAQISEKLPPFDAASARAALASVDVSTCRQAGAPQGYGHARVTFNPDGAISKVIVDEPAGLTPQALQCIGDRLGSVRAQPFEGSLVTVGTVWHVR